MTAINSLSFPFLSLFLSSLSPDSLSFPFLSLRQRERKGRSRKEENKERKRKEKGKEREYIVVIFPHFSLFFFFLSLFFFLLLSLVLYRLPARCPMSLLFILKTVTQKKFAVVSRCISSGFFLKYSSECVLLLLVNSFRSQLIPSAFF